MARVTRKVALKIAEGQTGEVVVTPEMLSDMLGPEPILAGASAQELPAGVATGFAWTEAGGDVLYIESDAAAEMAKD